MNNIKSILEENEEVLWQGKQNPVAVVVHSLMGMIIFLIIGYIFGFLGFDSANITCTVNGVVKEASECVKTFSLIGTILYVVAFSFPVFSLLHYFVTRYAVTEKRVIIKTGLIGADIKSLYFDQIRDLSVDVGIVGKLTGTGIIFLDTGKIISTKNGSQSAPEKIAHIDNPYSVYSQVQKLLSSRKENLFAGRT